MCFLPFIQRISFTFWFLCKSYILCHMKVALCDSFDPFKTFSFLGDGNRIENFSHFPLHVDSLRASLTDHKSNYIRQNPKIGRGSVKGSVKLIIFPFTPHTPEGFWSFNTRGSYSPAARIPLGCSRRYRSAKWGVGSKSSSFATEFLPHVELKNANIYIFAHRHARSHSFE